MPKQFLVPEFYRSGKITAIKVTRRERDPRRRDLAPTVIDYGAVRFKIARHFGFCFGVENAIDIAYKALDEANGRRVFLLSEMIHNPIVNADLVSRGIRFLMTPEGERLMDYRELTPADIVIVPAFGTTLEIQAELQTRGIDPYLYDTTCPFVEKVWKRAADLGARGFTVIIHGKATHEETRATFSHSTASGPSLVVRDMAEADFVVAVILGEESPSAFQARLGSQASPGFDPVRDLVRLGVVNQTTMLATETQKIAELFKATLEVRYGKENILRHFADTRDTLCYATNENQSATKALISSSADVAIVVGGYNSSNTSHLVELLEVAMPTYFVAGPDDILSSEDVRHFDLHTHSLRTTSPWLRRNPSLDHPAPPASDAPLDIAVTAGASCPDRTVDAVIEKISSFFPSRSDPRIFFPEADAA